MSLARRIRTALAAVVVLLPTTASLCLACVDCAAGMAAASTPDERAVGNSMVHESTAIRSDPQAHESCHQPAADSPRLVRSCCCEVEDAGPLAEDWAAPLLQQPLASYLSPAILPDLYADRHRPDAATRDRAPPRSRDRLSLHQTLLI